MVLTKNELGEIPFLLKSYDLHVQVQRFAKFKNLRWLLTASHIFRYKTLLFRQKKYSIQLSSNSQYQLSDEDNSTTYFLVLDWEISSLK